jgi:hypothetical protein
MSTCGLEIISTLGEFVGADVPLSSWSNMEAQTGIDSPLTLRAKKAKGSFTGQGSLTPDLLIYD